MTRWTDYYGDIRRVRIDYDKKKKLFTGHTLVESGIGVVFWPLRKSLGKEYFRTKKDAVKYFSQKKFSSLWWKLHPNAKTKTVLVSE